MDEDEQTIIAALMDEATIYCGPLLPLQGDVVPFFYGLWKASVKKESVSSAATDVELEDVYLAVMERVGRAIASSSDSEEMTIPDGVPHVIRSVLVDLSKCYETILTQRHIRDKILTLFRSIWAFGVVHGDIQSRHIRSTLDTNFCLFAQKELRLIDFDRGRIAESAEEVEVEVARFMEWMGG